MASGVISVGQSAIRFCPSGACTLVNTGTVPIYIDTSSTPTTGSVVIQPFGSIGVDGTQTYSLSTLSKSTGQISVLQGLTSYNPSQQQVALAAGSSVGLAAGSSVGITGSVPVVNPSNGQLVTSGNAREVFNGTVTVDSQGGVTATGTVDIALLATDRSIVVVTGAGHSITGALPSQYQASTSGISSGLFYGTSSEISAIPGGLVTLPAYGAADGSMAVTFQTPVGPPPVEIRFSFPCIIIATPDEVLLGSSAANPVVSDIVNFPSTITEVAPNGASGPTSVAWGFADARSSGTAVNGTIISGGSSTSIIRVWSAWITMLGNGANSGGPATLQVNGGVPFLGSAVGNGNPSSNSIEYHNGLPLANGSQPIIISVFPGLLAYGGIAYSVDSN